MIPYNKVSVSLKNDFIDFLAHSFLSVVNAEEHFEITLGLDALMIRDRTRTNRPLPEEKTKLYSLLEHLRKKNILGYSIASLSTNHGDTPILLITHINSQLLQNTLTDPQQRNILIEFAITTEPSHFVAPQTVAPRPHQPASQTPQAPTNLTQLLQLNGWERLNPIKAYNDFSQYLIIDGTQYIRFNPEGTSLQHLGNYLRQQGYTTPSGNNSFISPMNAAPQPYQPAPHSASSSSQVSKEQQDFINFLRTNGWEPLSSIKAYTHYPNNQITIDRTNYIKPDKNSGTSLEMLEQYLQRSGYQKLSSGNAFGGPEFRTPSPGIAPQPLVPPPYSNSQAPQPSAPPLYRSSQAPLPYAPPYSSSQAPQPYAPPYSSSQAPLPYAPPHSSSQFTPAAPQQPVSTPSSSNLGNSLVRGSLTQQFLAPPAAVSNTLAAKRALQSVPPNIRSQFTPKITQYWDQLSGPLQQHVINSIKNGQDARLAALTSHTGFNTFVDPIALDVSKIMVQLPGAFENKQCFELENILQLPRREHPITREPFTLEQITPVSKDMLHDLEQRFKGPR